MAIIIVIRIVIIIGNRIAIIIVIRITIIIVIRIAIIIENNSGQILSRRETPYVRIMVPMLYIIFIYQNYNCCAVDNL